MTYRKLPYIKL